MTIPRLLVMYRRSQYNIQYEGLILGMYHLWWPVRYHLRLVYRDPNSRLRILKACL
jgi:hypothetical protein